MGAISSIRKWISVLKEDIETDIKMETKLRIPLCMILKEKKKQT